MAAFSDQAFSVSAFDLNAFDFGDIATGAPGGIAGRGSWRRMPRPSGNMMLQPMRSMTGRAEGIRMRKKRRKRDDDEIGTILWILDYFDD